MAPDHPLRKAFLKWQCRVRQMAMRDNYGRPDDAITPAVYLPDQAEPMGHIITSGGSRRCGSCPRPTIKRRTVSRTF